MVAGNAARSRARARLNKVIRHQAEVNASFDLTRTTRENQRHWADSDALSGRSAYYKLERKTARERSRHEAANNSWYSGILRTAANHIFGSGPRLQVMTDDNVLNAAIERSWRKWTKATNFYNRMRMAVETYWRDGEVFLMKIRRPTLRPVDLDVRFFESDQVSQPWGTAIDPSLEDGIRVDMAGNPIEFWFLDHHPGDLTIGHTNYLSGKWFDAEDVIHLFRQDRPGQLRGFPRCAPGLEHLAHMRRFSKATLASAEQSAVQSTFMKTTAAGIRAARMPSPWLVTDFERNAVNYLPEGWEPFQLKSENPGTTNEQYQRTELTYFTRCTGQPYSLAAGTSRDSNFASAKMDIKNTWEPEVKSEQSTIDVIVMAKTFRWFLEALAIDTDVLDNAGLLDEIDFQFFWPPLPVSDEADQADAVATRIATGQSTFSTEAASMGGVDDDALVQQAARDNGVTPEEYRQARFNKTFGIVAQAPAGANAQLKKLAARQARRRAQYLEGVRLGN